MNKSFVLLLIFICSSGYAQNTEILNCKVSNAEWTAKFILDSAGSGFLKFKKASDPKSYICSLKLEFIQDGQRSISPNITVDFVRGACDPELGSLKQEIFERFSLIVNIRRKDKPEGNVQWLRRKQLDPCHVEKIKMFDISMNAKKWQNGTWGRRTASEPKKSKP